MRGGKNYGSQKSGAKGNEIEPAPRWKKKRGVKFMEKGGGAETPCFGNKGMTEGIGSFTAPVTVAAGPQGRTTSTCKTQKPREEKRSNILKHKYSKKA